MSAAETRQQDLPTLANKYPRQYFAMAYNNNQIWESTICSTLWIAWNVKIRTVNELKAPEFSSRDKK